MAMNCKRFFLVLAFSCAVIIVRSQSLPQLGKNSVQEVVSAMTLEEKVNLLVGGGMNVPGMQIPGVPAVQPTDAQKRVLGASRQEERFGVRPHAPVEERHLRFRFIIGDAPQAAQDHTRACPD